MPATSGPDRDSAANDNEDGDRRDPIFIFDGDRLLFDYVGDDPDANVGTYLIIDRNGVERGRGRFRWNNGTTLDTWQPAERYQSGSGQ